ncbi:3-oxoacyl-ACP reductase FabG [Henriciella sp.]|uniref:3-oxoacyl-ACP reductase FabG n=1 Tax=Henriciella sp. TaxID=1968823 RepID=UPI00260CAAD3|nr:3-oxoacyl-ACP reductase FabG [Henriciella sp.]
MSARPEPSTSRVLVTGASKGIGRAIACQLGGMGFDICVHYGGDRDGAEQTCQMISERGGQANILGFDVTDGDASRTALEEELENRGPFWGVVSNAGITRDKPFPGIEPDDWDKVVRTSLDGFYNVVHPLILPMIRARKGGRIIAMASVSGVMGNRGQVNYSAAKAGLIGAVKALAVELASRKITVNAVAPGLIETAMTEDVRPEIMTAIPMKRAGTVEEVAAVAGFLFQPEASYVTRQVIGVNGGLI